LSFVSGSFFGFQLNNKRHVSLLRCLQALHKEALVWLSFGKKRQQMELASNNQVASNRRYCSRPLPAEPQKKLVFDWEVELKDGAEHYTSSYLLHKGYYLYGAPLDYQIYAAVFPNSDTGAQLLRAVEGGGQDRVLYLHPPVPER
jgi:hypothetical protein